MIFIILALWANSIGSLSMDALSLEIIHEDQTIEELNFLTPQ